MTSTSPLTLASGGEGAVEIPAEDVPYPITLAVAKMTSRVADLARAHGLARTADALLAAPAASAGPGSARLVVTGPLGAGSSSLVNALLGEPGLLPVDDYGTPHAPVWIDHGPRRRAVVVRPRTPEAVGQNAVPDGSAAAAGTYVTNAIDLVEVAGTAVEVSGTGATVHVQLDAPGLAGLQILDAGALTGGEAGALLALHYASLGDAVLVTHDVAAPPGAQERAALCTLAAHAARVYLVLTRTDAAIDHEPVVAATRRMVETTPGLGSVEVLTTSSHLAVKASRLRESGSEHAGTLAELGGVEQLARVLRADLVGRHVAARLLAQAKACARAADEIVVASAPAPDVDADALAVERGRLASLLSGEASSKLALQQAIQRMKAAPRAALTAGVRQVRAQMRERIEQVLPADMDLFEQQVQGALAEVVSTVWQQQGDLAAEAAAVVERGWDGHQEQTRLRVALTEVDLAQAPTGALEALGERSAAALVDQSAQHRAMLTRSALMMLPSMMHPARAAAGLVGLGIAARMTARGQSQEQDRQVRQQLRNWLDHACNDANSALLTALDSRALVAHQHLDDRVLELSGDLRARKDGAGNRLSRHKPAPDPARDEVTRLVRDTRALVDAIADRSKWPEPSTRPSRHRAPGQARPQPRPGRAPTGPEGSED